MAWYLSNTDQHRYIYIKNIYIYIQENKTAISQYQLLSVILFDRLKKRENSSRDSVCVCVSVHIWVYYVRGEGGGWKGREGDGRGGGRALGSRTLVVVQMAMYLTGYSDHLTSFHEPKTGLAA